MTDHLPVEDALRVAGESFRKLVEQSPFGVYAVDADFRLVMVSAGAQKVFANVRPLLGRDFDEVLRILWPEPFVSEALAHFRHTLATGEPYHAPSTVERRADIGETESYDWKLERTILPDGRPGVVCHFYDLSERQRYEESLRVARTRLEAALAASQVVLFHQDRELRYTWIHNPALGMTADGVIGKRDSDLFARAEDAAVTEALKRDVLRTGIARRSEVCIVHDGRPRFYDLVVQPDRDGSGEIVGVHCAAVDITERRELEERLRDADRKKDEFLATLAHELRNPLTPLRAALELLKRPSPDAATIERSLAMMERQVVQMSHLIDDLMDLSRIGGGKIVLQKRHVDLAEVVRDVVDATLPLVHARRQQLDLDLPDEVVLVDGDVTRLSQIVTNLVNNAAKFTEGGGRIRVAVARDGDAAVVTVRDTGIGIPADKLDVIFGMFTQVDQSLERSQGGLGLGLHLAKRLVEMHGGTIEARSEGAGRGAEFVVRLPIALPLPLATGGDEREAEPPAPPAMPSSSLCILLVDDNRDSADVWCTLLAHHGHETHAAYDGEEALALAERIRPDAILLDIGLPALNGYDVCRRVRECEWGKTALMIAATGWGQPSDLRRSQEAGFDHHLVKPLDHRTLLSLFASHARVVHERAGGEGETPMR